MLLIVLDWFIHSIFKMVYLVNRRHILLGPEGQDGVLNRKFDNGNTNQQMWFSSIASKNSTMACNN